jgi:predicted RNA-binding protein with PIN domain
MRYLIDGYNLLHAWGLAPPRGSRPGQLERARLNLLDRIRFVLGPAVAGVTVVFDASHAAAGSAAEKDYHGIRVCFPRDGSADDCIEELIRREPKPRELTVVSDDHRLHQAAGHRHCHAQRCLDYIEELQTRHPAAPDADAPRPQAKPESPSPEEARRWLEEFGEVDGDLF